MSMLEEKDRRKRNTAQQRWRILAKTLIGTQDGFFGNTEEDEVSIRRFGSFDLLKIVRLENTGEDTYSRWYEYSAILENMLYSVRVRWITKSFTANELIGFNNTGNVCIWPSEECLAYYLLKNREVCRGRRVLELGGGMSCLAGVIAAKYCGPSSVVLTDGNPTSVENVRCIVAGNDLADFVECGVVQWAKAAKAIRTARSARTSVYANSNGLRVKNWTTGDDDAQVVPEKLFDVILCADCLFFDEARSDLVETIHGWLTNDGLALVMAPRRGTTFQTFVGAAAKRGFLARQIDRYDGTIWSRHSELLDHSQEYCPDLHYPILLELTKQKRMMLPG
ncbi:Calmodulin-lysine N-methyltransferase [Dufourea novaeangliae]|uniref:Calmodulin-lysine N-methyltransferase n=1 Tax=Dufourea novaeangliae TaxID=178035 RepID=A0A154PB62_DUFNO|nr:Calmodulin-lysine N-methyltransferase [Dufourea novaeangliae]